MWTLKTDDWSSCPLRIGPWVLALIAFWLAPSTGVAQILPDPAPAALTDTTPALVILTRHTKFKLELVEHYQSRSHLDGADAIGTHTMLRPSLRVPFARWGEFDVSTRFDVRHFDFEGRSELVSGTPRGGTPFDPLYSYRVRVGANFRVSENTYLSIGGFSQASWEDGSDIGDADRNGGYAAVGVQLDPRWFVATGVGVRTRLGSRNHSIAPIVRMQLQATDTLRLQIQNFTMRLRQELSDEWMVTLSARLSNRTYELRSRGSDRASELEERSYPVLLELTRRLPNHDRLTFHLGAYFDQRLRSDAGDRRQTIDQGAVVFAGASFSLRN